MREKRGKTDRWERGRGEGRGKREMSWNEGRQVKR